MNALDQWEIATENLTVEFVKKYFTNKHTPIQDVDFWWVSDIPGTTLYVNDYFFDLERIVEALRYKATIKKLFEYYWYELEQLEKNQRVEVNFKNYLKLK